MIKLSAHARGTVFNVRARPNARRAGILGEHAGCLRVAVTAAPEHGKANAAVVEVLAAALGCRGSDLVLLSGATSRVKLFLALDLGPDALRRRLEALTSDPD